MRLNGLTSSKKPKSKGFTLLELLCCILLVSLLFLQSLPSINRTLNKNQLEMAEDEINHAIAYARKMALIVNVPLALTPLPDSTDWSKGMVLFIDNKLHRCQSGDKLLHQWQWNFSTVQIQWKGFESTQYILFANDLLHAATSGHFDLYSTYGESKRLVLNRLGRTSPTPIRLG